MSASNDRLAITYGLIAVLMWSTVATAFKLSLEQLSILQLLLGASVVSWLILLVALVLQQQLSMALQSLGTYFSKSLVFALFNPVLYYLILLKAYALLPAQIAQVINYTWAISLTLLSIPLLGHKVTARDSVAIALCYGGVIVIVFGTQLLTGTVHWQGVILALLSTLIWAAYWLLNVRDTRSSLVKLFQSFTLALPVLWLLTWVFDSFEPLYSLTSWFYIGYIGIFEMGLAFIFWQMALAKASRVSKISTLIFLSPVISLFIIDWFLGETILWTTPVALSMIIGGILYQQFGWPALFTNS